MPRHATKRDEASPDHLTTVLRPRTRGMHISYQPAGPVVRRWRVRYLSTTLKFAVACVAASCWVRNSRNGLLARLQAWDYMLGIAAVRRIQGLFQGTPVAQGAFSLYRTDDVRAVGAWPDAIGEDIVLTWQFMRRMVPGLVLACFGCFWFVGPTTVAVLPMTVVVYGVLLHFQRLRVLEPLGLVHRRSAGAFLIFLVFYQALMSATSIYGYAQELFSRKRSWK